MNKFQKLMSDTSNGTLERRSEAISSQAEIAQQTVVNTIKNQISELRIKISNLTDFAPNSTDSLQPGKADWNPTEWATALQRTKWDLYLAEQQLKLAEETYDEFFKDVDA